MAAAAATLAAVPTCGKRDAADIAGAATATATAMKPNKAKRGRSPPAGEVEAFLAAAESGAARRFAAKYNYDVVKDAPMDGQYDWARVGP